MLALRPQTQLINFHLDWITSLRVFDSDDIDDVDNIDTKMKLPTMMNVKKTRFISMTPFKKYLIA